MNLIFSRQHCDKGMIRIAAIFFASVVFSVLAACANTTMSDAAALLNESATREGNAYRWQYSREGEFEEISKRLIGEPAPTSADQALDSFTRSQISSVENEQHIDPTTAPKEVRLVSKSSDHVEEVWVYELGEVTQAFVVQFSPSASGGTEINITGPW